MVVAPVVVQLSVVLEPELMLVGFAVKELMLGLETCPPPLPDPPPVDEPEEPSEDDAPLQLSIPRQAMATRVSAQRRAQGDFSAREAE
jgi:hypothetical protein